MTSWFVAPTRVAIPKSPKSGRPNWEYSTFAGLRSWCTIPMTCAVCTAEATWTPIFSASSIGSGPFARRSARDGIGQYCMTT